VHLAQAEQQEAELNYQQPFSRHFAKCPTRLLPTRKGPRVPHAAGIARLLRKDASRLSDIRYRGGASSYLEVLDSNTRTYAAELTLVQHS